MSSIERAGPLEPNASSSINKYLNAIKNLKEAGVIRSDRVDGDIGEYIAARVFGLTLEDSLQQNGYDARLEGSRFQIKYNNSAYRNNINVGDPDKYDFLIVVIGPNSKLRSTDHVSGEFRCYKYESKDVKLWRKNAGCYCAKSRLEGCHSVRSVILSADDARG